MRAVAKIDPSWEDRLMPLLKGDPGLVELTQNVMPQQITYPFKEDIFNVFTMPLQSVKVVILGQDPYPQKNVGVGRAFAVNADCYIPPSLKYIKAEISRSLSEEEKAPVDSRWKTLQHLSDQGVFLLNTALTVKSSTPGSHQKYWKNFTETVIKLISTQSPCIWLLWGKHAKSYIPKIYNNFMANQYTDDTVKEIPQLEENNYILTSPHPVVEYYNKGKIGGGGFVGNNHFKRTNQILEKFNKQKIQW